MRWTLAGCLLFLAAACAAPQGGNYSTPPDPDRDREFIEEPITQLDDLGGGIVAIALGPMARSFVIHPDFSPNAKGLVVFARKARVSGRPVHATAWIRDHSPKTPPPWDGVQWPFIIVRLADGPDPRAVKQASDQRPLVRR